MPRRRSEPDDRAPAPAAERPSEASGAGDLQRELKKLQQVLQHEGQPAFRATFSARLAARQQPIPQKAAAKAVQIVKSLAGPDGGEAAVEVTAWLLRSDALEIAEESLWQLARRLTALDAAAACAAHLPGAGAKEAPTLLLLGMLHSLGGEQVEARRRFELALAAGLPPSLEAAARAELCAARFHRIGPSRAASGRAVALIEPDAAADLLRSALAEAESLRVCADDRTVLAGAGLEAAVAEGRLSASHWRFRTDEATFEATALFARRLLERLRSELGERLLLDGLDSEQLEGFRAALTLRCWRPMAFVCNALATLDRAEAGRVFVVADDGWLTVPLAERIVAEGRQELWVACGSPSRRSRRRFAAALGPGSSLASLRALQADGDEPGKEDAGPLGSPLIEVTPARPPLPGRRPCLLCPLLPSASLRGATVLAPLQELVERLLPEWDPMILVLAPGRSDRDAILAGLQEGLGPLLPQVRVTMLDLRAAFAAPGVTASVARRVDALLLDPAVQDIELGGLQLARLLRAPSQGFVASLLRTAAVAPWLEELLQSWAPQVILAARTFDVTWKYLQIIARRHGIPTLEAQDSAVGSNPWTPAPDADHYLCFDAHSRAVFADSGRLAPERASPIGSLRWDASLRRARRFDRQAERDALGLDARQKLVLLATQPLDMEDNHALVELALTALQDLPEAVLVVKLHPREPADRLAAIEGQLRRSPLAGRARALLAYDTYRLLAAADLVVNAFSNVGLEAALLDLDVVSVETSPETELFSLSELGLVAPARDHQTAIAQIRGLLRDPEQQAAARALRDSYFDLDPQLRDGRARDRLAAALDEAAQAASAGTWAAGARRRPLGQGLDS